MSVFQRHVFSACLAFVPALILGAGPATAQTAWPMPDWQTAKPDTQGMSQERIDQVRDWLKEHGSKTGMLVRHGRIVGEWYWEDAKPESKFRVYSTTKSFSSTAAGLAIADGKLALDTKVGDLLPDVKPDEKRNVTVRQLLSMTSGVHNEANISDLPELFDYALFDAPMDHRPGTKWDYNNTGLAILSPVIYKATGQQVDQILDAKVFKPIGINEADWSWEHRGETTIPYSGLMITARALARFGLLFLNGGKWQDKQLVPAGWVAEATGSSQEMNKSYGYLW